jgi:sugar lactone lactonase YvrE
MTGVTCLWEAHAELGEGPVWVAAEQALYWVDIKGGSVHRFDPASGDQNTWRPPVAPCSLQATEAGGFVGAFRTGFAAVAFVGHDVRLEWLSQPEPDRPGNRFNDGKIDPAGRFWAGSMDDAEKAATGALYCLGPDLHCRRMDDGYVITNGPAFSLDGSRLYHTDTLGRVIYQFDLATDGTISGKRRFVEIPADAGCPDGMCVDAEDGLWVAHFGGARLSRYDPHGRQSDRIDLPVSQVTSCAFGGAEYRDLFITTAAVGLSPEQQRAEPLAGGLFHCRPGVAGIAAGLFAGSVQQRAVG